MKTLLFVTLLLVSTQTVLASDCENTPNSFNCVNFVRNYDGDTITFNIDDVHPLLGSEISVRVLGVDTPEIRGTSGCEKNKALKVKDFVGTILNSAARIDLVNVQRDKYFRVLADVLVDGESLSDMLIERRYAYPYYGGTKQDINWCQY
jgi:micrococcal nuclease